MKAIATGILTVMVTGLVGNALALWKNSAVVEHRVETIEKKQEKQDNDYSDLNKKVDQIHWYLIRSKKIVVPPEE